MANPGFQQLSHYHLHLSCDLCEITNLNGVDLLDYYVQQGYDCIQRDMYEMHKHQGIRHQTHLILAATKKEIYKDIARVEDDLQRRDADEKTAEAFRNRIT